MDVFTKERRSEIMSRIRGRGNESTEVALITLMRANGITGWRRNADLPGHPDFIFKKQKVAVFVDGCFWHCCPIHFRYPKANSEFWRLKIDANTKRDKKNNRKLRLQGWRVMRIWEHDIDQRPTFIANKLWKRLND